MTASRRADAQAAAQAGAGRWQLRRSAGIASRVRSAFQPGSSLQGTSSQRARGRSRVPLPAAAAGTPSSTGSGGGGSVRAGAGGVGLATGVPAQATSSAAQPAARVPRMVPARRLAPWEVVDMWVILLEALIALLLLGGIVWWTMFAGRRRGERHDPD